ncbi:MAG TPA: hypothetical protein VFY75_11225 [Solirubrobacterales bacterium]|nr:hypothetical protein [Solirubrobacterales bacterium]
MRHLRLLLPFALLALALGLAACGGGESDEDKVVEVIETSVTSTDPADCEKLATQAFLEQTQFSKGTQAVKDCEEDADDKNHPDAAEVSNVKVDGSQATADTTVRGGVFDGQTLTVALVEEDGDWKLDKITAFAKFDQGKFAASLEGAVKSGKEPLDPEITSCLGDALRKLPKAEAEQMLIGGSTQPIFELVEGCAPESGQ